MLENKAVMSRKRGRLVGFPAGYLYVGQWQHNKKSGEGHLYSSKERYWGQFFDNKYHGKVLVASCYKL